MLTGTHQDFCQSVSSDGHPRRDIMCQQGLHVIMMVVIVTNFAISVYVPPSFYHHPRRQLALIVDLVRAACVSLPPQEKLIQGGEILDKAAKQEALLRKAKMEREELQQKQIR
jgi:hypothetical protein